MLRSLLSVARDTAHIARGGLTFSRTGETPAQAYQSMINLYCRTRGLSNDVLHAFIKARRRPFDFPSRDGILGNVSGTEAERINGKLREDGYYVFPQRLAPDVCDRLTQLALRAEANPRPQRPGIPKMAVYSPEKPLAEAYHFPAQTLLDDPDVQRLIADYSILSVAQSYLGSQPVLDIITMWWSTSGKFDAGAAAELAQLYHFDMDRIKWLKFFFYLTDVTPENGPHTFVARSHVRGGQPAHLLKRGYSRIEDHEIEDHYRPDDRIEMTGPRGTIIAEDTRGFHKGKVPNSGHRLVLQFEFADSLFGGGLPNPRPVIRPTSDKHLTDAVRRYPHVYSMFGTDGI